MSSTAFSSWKFDLIGAMVSDSRIPDGALRMALRVLQAVNEGTGIGIIGDETLADEVPHCSKSKCNRVRALLEELGWWEVEPGSGGTASHYRFLDKNVNAILDVNMVLRERRKERRKKKRKEQRDRWLERKRLADGGPTNDTSTGREEANAEIALMTPLQGGRGVTNDTLSRGGEMSLVHQNASLVTPVHLIHTPSVGSLSVESGIPDSAVREGADKEGLPRPGSVEDARRIFIRYFGKQDPGRGHFIKNVWLDYEDWIEKYAKRGLMDRECKEINAEISKWTEAAQCASMSAGA